MSGSPAGLQLVLICGGRGTRLPGRGDGAGKSMVEIAGEPLVGHLLRSLGTWHRSAAPPVVLAAEGDHAIEAFVKSRHPQALFVRQGAPDGVANAVLLTAPHVREHALVVLGDLFLDGRIEEPLPPPPAVGIWHEAPASTTRKNFGVRLDGARRVAAFFEKPVATDDLLCGIGAYLLTRQHIESFAKAPVNSKTGEREITAALDYLRSREMIGTFRFEGLYVNVNSVEDRELAERHLGARGSRASEARGSGGRQIVERRRRAEPSAIERDDVEVE